MQQITNKFQILSCLVARADLDMFQIQVEATSSPTVLCRWMEITKLYKFLYEAGSGSCPVSGAAKHNITSQASTSDISCTASGSFIMAMQEDLS